MGDVKIQEIPNPDTENCEFSDGNCVDFFVESFRSFSLLGILRFFGLLRMTVFRQLKEIN